MVCDGLWVVKACLHISKSVNKWCGKFHCRGRMSQRERIREFPFYLMIYDDTLKWEAWLHAKVKGCGECERLAEWYRLKGK